ncbi:hypothetical protein GCM10025778_35970 [Paeniglutamicibacter antarcticus]|uniref:Uncharacterized protein n=1 Tax=Paeniglutamicibacter antarcticus TaxID=494023 RepID=A0ABP9TT83_9MICC
MEMPGTVRARQVSFADPDPWPGNKEDRARKKADGFISPDRRKARQMGPKRSWAIGPGSV